MFGFVSECLLYANEMVAVGGSQIAQMGTAGQKDLED